jgi:hypothetical protein
MTTSDTELPQGNSKADVEKLLNQAMAQLNDPSQFKDFGDNTDPDEVRRAVTDFKKALEQGVLNFPPVLAGAQQLSAATFGDHNVKPVPGMDDLLARYDFYYIPIPVTAFIGPGASYRRVDIKIDLDPDKKAVFYSLFPTTEALTVLNFTDQLTVGVDGNFKVAASSNVAAPANPAVNASENIGTNTTGAISGKLVIGPFSYTLSRPLVRSAGEGNVTAMWTLDSAQKIEGPSPLQLITVVQVPKGTTSLSARGQLQGYLKANIAANLGELLGSIGYRLMHLFSGEQPISGEPPVQVWDNILPR